MARRPTIAKLAALPLPPHVRDELARLVAEWAPLGEQLAAADADLGALAAADPVVTRLRTMPTIGPITALAYVAALDDVTRFTDAHQVQGYLGLVPSEYSSGDRRVRGRITKRGDVRLRWLLVEAGWRVVRAPNAEWRDLRTWGVKVADRRGKPIAAVALARRLAAIRYAMWRDGTSYRARQLESAASRPTPTRARTCRMIRDD